MFKALEESTEKINSYKLYAYMASMYTNIEISRGDFGDILQLTNFILDSDVTCHMTPEISYFVLRSFMAK